MLFITLIHNRKYTLRRILQCGRWVVLIGSLLDLQNPFILLNQNSPSMCINGKRRAKHYPVFLGKMECYFKTIEVISNAGRSKISIVLETCTAKRLSYISRSGKALALKVGATVHWHVKPTNNTYKVSVSSPSRNRSRTNGSFRWNLINGGLMLLKA